MANGIDWVKCAGEHQTYVYTQYRIHVRITTIYMCEQLRMDTNFVETFKMEGIEVESKQLYFERNGNRKGIQSLQASTTIIIITTSTGIVVCDSSIVKWNLIWTYTYPIIIHPYLE